MLGPVCVSDDGIDWQPCAPDPCLVRSDLLLNLRPVNAHQCPPSPPLALVSKGGLFTNRPRRVGLEFRVWLQRGGASCPQLLGTPLQHGDGAAKAERSGAERSGVVSKAAA